MQRMFGPSDWRSPPLFFDRTRYYEKEMGWPLHRRFLSFTNLIRPEAIVDVKLQTNELEKDYLQEGRRRDPWIHEYSGDVYERIKGCDALVVMVAHSEYRELDLHKLKSALRLPVLVDGRQVLDAGMVRSTGFNYRRVGAGVS